LAYTLHTEQVFLRVLLLGLVLVVGHEGGVLQPPFLSRFLALFQTTVVFGLVCHIQQRPEALVCDRAAMRFFFFLVETLDQCKQLLKSWRSEDIEPN
jgi:hypothetical protein